MSIVCLVFSLHGFPWTALGWVSLAFSAGLWAGRRSAEPVLAAATSVRSVSVSKAVL
jgi:hypothetical protein